LEANGSIHCFKDLGNPTSAKAQKDNFFKNTPRNFKKLEKFLRQELSIEVNTSSEENSQP
jgi:hypothetical protein